MTWGFGESGAAFATESTALTRGPCLQHHAGASAERWRVDGAPLVQREITQLDEIDFDSTGFNGPSNDAGVKRTFKHFGEQRDYR
jgi:hypothetical protein